MTLRKITLALAAAALFTTGLAAAEQTQTGASTQGSDEPATYSSAKEPRRKIGEKTWKERINTVARVPREHDIKWIDSRDRTSWQGHSTWQGIRDERPLIARKTLGFHDPRPHRTRAERVLLISRGPIQGPGFQR
jgi:hypothetical protein